MIVLATVALGTAALAHAYLASAMRAMGGQSKLQSISTISMTAVGTRAMVEQSERPSGPYFLDHFRRIEIRDLVHGKLRIEQSDEAYAADAWWLQQVRPDRSTVIVNNDVAARIDGNSAAYAGTAPVQLAEEEFAFAPERLLQTASSASSLRVLADVTLHGVRHHVVTFTWKGAPCKLFLNAFTNLPWQIEWTRAYPYHTFLNAWGEVTSSLTFNSWTLEPYGISYPREWTYERIGLPEQQFAIIQLRINRHVDDAQLTVPANLYTAHHGHMRRVADIPLGFHGSPDPVTVAPNVVQYSGGWNIEFVRERDGLIAIEAPWSPQYTARAFAAAEHRFHSPLKAVITTSDSWPHIAGVRQAVAMGVPVYALDLNEPILRRLLNAPHRQFPDLLQLHPRQPRFVLVGKPTSLGSGNGALQIIPYRSATGERQMMVYIAASQLLYTSDLLAPDGNGWFTPQYVQELLQAVQRNHLRVRTVFGMHYGATPFSALQAYEHAFLTSAPGSQNAANLSSQLSSLGFFIGTWDCSGTFASSGKAISSTEEFEPDLGGTAVLKHHFDNAPATYDAVELWKYDAAAKTYSDVIQDNYGGVRTFVSPGWNGSALRWITNVAGKSQVFAYERMSDNAYRVEFHVVNGPTDRLVDSLVCSRRTP